MTARKSPPERRGPGRAPKHASRALAALLAKNAIDGRTWVSRALRDIRLDLARDAGGLDRMTARERVLLDRCAAAVLICSTIEAHVFAAEKPINDAGELLPILRRGYVSHVQSLSRMLQALGLRPDRAEKAPSLHELLRPPASGAPDGRKSDDRAAVEAETRAGDETDGEAPR